MCVVSCPGLKFSIPAIQWFREIAIRPSREIILRIQQGNKKASARGLKLIAIFVMVEIDLHTHIATL